MDHSEIASPDYTPTPICDITKRNKKDAADKVTLDIGRQGTKKHHKSKHADGTRLDISDKNNLGPLVVPSYKPDESDAPLTKTKISSLPRKNQNVMGTASIPDIEDLASALHTKCGILAAAECKVQEGEVTTAGKTPNKPVQKERNPRNRSKVAVKDAALLDISDQILSSNTGVPTDQQTDQLYSNRYTSQTKKVPAQNHI